jgi:hypothetical protein
MSPARTGAPHLFSGIIAVGVAATILFVGRMVAIHLEHKSLHTVAPREFQLKNQGLAFQRAAARAGDVLPSPPVTLPPKAGCFTILFLTISFMGVSQGVDCGVGVPFVHCTAQRRQCY